MIDIFWHKKRSFILYKTPLLSSKIVYSKNYCPRYCLRSFDLVLCFNLLTAFSLICLTLSLVRPILSPISSRVSAWGIPIQKYIFTTSLSLLVSVLRDLLISSLSDSISSQISVASFSGVPIISQCVAGLDSPEF